MEKEKTEQPIQNSFITTLLSIRKGLSVNELSEELAKLIAQVRETHKAGELVYKIKIKPANADANQLFVIDEIDNKLPQPNRDTNLFFATDDNQLTREDPDQKKLDLREVKKEVEQPVRKVASA